MRVADVRVLKKLIAVLGNRHGGAILVGLLTIGGAIAGLIVGAVTACRVGRRMT
jgi:hypothetical protein